MYPARAHTDTYSNTRAYGYSHNAPAHSYTRPDSTLISNISLITHFASRSAQAHTDTYTNTRANGHSHPNAPAHFYTRSDSTLISNSNPNPNPDAHSISNTHLSAQYESSSARAHTDTYSYTRANGYCPSNAPAHCYTRSDSTFISNPNPDRDADSISNTHLTTHYRGSSARDG